MILVFQHSDSSPLGTLNEILNEHAMGLRVVRLHRGEEIPADLDDVDGIISLGGPQSANDANPALEREMALMRTANAMSMPILGICLGAQLLGKALGGEVSRLEKPEIGWHEHSLTPVGREDPLFAGIGWNTAQFQWHADQVSKLPPGARLLGSSRLCKAQAWGVGLRTYAVQFHPEVEESTIHRWLREGPEELAPAGTSSNELLEGTRRHLADMQRATERMMGNWALYVAPVDRRYRGLARDMVH